MIKIAGPRIAAAALVVLLASCALPSPSLSGQGTAEQLTLERFLATARIVEISVGTSGGRSEPWVLRLSDGTTERKGFFKYIHRPRPGFASESYKREIAAYKLTKGLGVDFVPPVVERTIEDRRGRETTGSLQLFVENCLSEDSRQLKKLEPPDPRAFANALDEIAVFENLVYCPREDLTDLLVHKDTWKVCRVDFMEAFEPVPRLLPRSAIGRCSKRLYRGLEAADPKVLRAMLKPYLDADETEALLERRLRIIETLRAAIKTNGEAAVLF
jgi:hypothetical protein